MVPPPLNERGEKAGKALEKQYGANEIKGPKMP